MKIKITKRIQFFLYFLITSLIFPILFIIVDFGYALYLPGSNYAKDNFNENSRHHERYNNIKIRNTPHNHESSLNLVFAGCSFIYGDGLIDEETLSAQVSLLTNEYHIINQGKSGGGIHHTLYDYLNNEMSSKYLKNKQSIIVYGIHIDQLFRIDHSKAGCCPPWGPRYILKNDEVIQDGYLEKFTPFNFIKNFILNSEIINRSFLNKLYSWKITQESEFLYCKILKKLNDTLNLQGNKLYVFSYENFIGTPRLESCIKDNNINIINVEAIDKDQHIIGNGDLHPNLKYNKLIAKQIVNYLEKLQLKN